MKYEAILLLTYDDIIIHNIPLWRSTHLKTLQILMGKQLRRLWLILKFLFLIGLMLAMRQVHTENFEDIDSVDREWNKRLEKSGNMLR